jgi:benzoyl-CoA-dihydrodiol lyase
MAVDEDGGIRPGYKLKLNSYDLGVDIELADALQRIRFEHPEVRCVILTSGVERVLLLGANIFMLGMSSHAWKVNFCKFTNETRNAIEDASRHSGLKFIAACNGTTAGGGYELALACDEILLIDDRSSAVSLPEVPLLGVLPGTGGLTRLTDKRHVRAITPTVLLYAGGRRARATGAGMAADRHHAKPMQFAQTVRERALALAETSDRPRNATGVLLPPLARYGGTGRLPLRARRCDDRPRGAARDDHRARARRAGARRHRFGRPQRGASWWPLAMARELDDAILCLRTNELDIGTWIVKTEGALDRVLAADAVLERHRSHWFVRGERSGCCGERSPGST